VLRCKRAKWEIQEKQRLRRRSTLLDEFWTKLDQDMKHDIATIDAEANSGAIGRVEADERRSEIRDDAQKKIDELRTVFSLADPQNFEKREVPDHLIDDISFEIMHDPVVTKHGHSYERATITEHLKKNKTDPLHRDVLTIDDLRPNRALKKACDEFWEQNKGWAYEW